MDGMKIGWSTRHTAYYFMPSTTARSCRYASAREFLPRQSMRDGAGGAIDRTSLRRHGAHVGEADVAQHGVQSRDVRCPPVRRVVVQLAAAVERHRRPGDADHVHDGFEKEALPRDRGDVLESQERMAQMIEDAEKKHDVELADALGREIHDVDVDILDLRAERLRAPARIPPSSPSRGRATRSSRRQRRARRRGVRPRRRRTRPTRRCREPSGQRMSSEDPAAPVAARCHRHLW